jgi:hypothetical protein
MTRYAERAAVASYLTDAVAVGFPARLGRMPFGLNADESYQRGAPQAAADTAASSDRGDLLGPVRHGLPPVDDLALLCGVS